LQGVHMADVSLSAAWTAVRDRLPPARCLCCTDYDDDASSSTPVWAAYATPEKGLCSLCAQIVSEMQDGGDTTLTMLQPEEMRSTTLAMLQPEEVRARCQGDPRTKAWRLSQDDSGMRAALLEAVDPHVMSAQRFGQLIKIVRKQLGVLTPEGLVGLLEEGDPVQFLSETQATELYALVANLPKQESYSHVIVSHVITGWCLNRDANEDPRLGPAECFYDFWSTHSRADLASRLLTAADRAELAEELLLDCVEAMEKRDAFLQLAQQGVESASATGEAAEAALLMEEAPLSLPAAPTSIAFAFPDAPKTKVKARQKKLLHDELTEADGIGMALPG